MENGLSNSSKRSLKISLRSPKRNLKKNPDWSFNKTALSLLLYDAHLKIKTAHQGVATHSLRTIALSNSYRVEYELWSDESTHPRRNPTPTVNGCDLTPPTWIQQTDRRQHRTPASLPKAFDLINAVFEIRVVLLWRPSGVRLLLSIVSVFITSQFFKSMQSNPKENIKTCLFLLWYSLRPEGKLLEKKMIYLRALWNF